MAGLPVDWTKGLDDKDSFETLVRNSTQVLGRLKEIIEEYESNVVKEEITSKYYDNPAWAYKQAHNNGVRQGLKKVVDLLSFMEK